MASDSNMSRVTPATPRPSSPFLSLAPELRNAIYRLVLPNGEALEVTKDELRGRTTLLHTCKQDKDEAASIFYGENFFSILLDGELEHTNAAAAWLRNLGDHAKLLERMYVHVELSRSVAGRMAMARFAARLMRPPPHRSAVEDAGDLGRTDAMILGDAVVDVHGKHGGPVSEAIVLRFASAGATETTMREAYCEKARVELSLRGLVNE